MGQLVVVVERGHQTLLGQGERHPRGVAGDPAAAPLLGDVGCCAAAASGVEYEVAWVGGHQNAALNNLRIGLHNVGLARSTTKTCPDVRDGNIGKIVGIPFENQSCLLGDDAVNSV